MQTLDEYVKEVRDYHKQAVEMFKDVKENHLAHIEPDIQSIKKDISEMNTKIGKLVSLLEKHFNN